MLNYVTNLEKNGGGIITSFTDDFIAGKLLAMGVLPGSWVRVVRIAPFNGGYYLKIDGMNIALRSEEAAAIVVSKSDNHQVA